MIRIKKIYLIVITYIILVISVVGYYIIMEAYDVKYRCCPYKHYSLKRIPILYGYPNLDDSILVRELKNKEIYLGGEMMHNNRPSYKYFCTKCSYDLYQIEGRDIWKRFSENLKSFEIPLNKIIACFPIFEVDTLDHYGFLKYGQKFESNKVVYETVSYNSNRDIKHIDSLLIRYLSQRNISMERIDSPHNIIKYKNTSSQLICELELTDLTNNKTCIVFSWTDKSFMLNGE